MAIMVDALVVQLHQMIWLMLKLENVFLYVEPYKLKLRCSASVQLGTMKILCSTDASHVRILILTVMNVFIILLLSWEIVLFVPCLLVTPPIMALIWEDAPYLIIARQWMEETLPSAIFVIQDTIGNQIQLLNACLVWIKTPISRTAIMMGLSSPVLETLLEFPNI